VRQYQTNNLAGLAVFHSAPIKMKKNTGRNIFAPKLECLYLDIAIHVPKVFHDRQKE